MGEIRRGMCALIRIIYACALGEGVQFKPSGVCGGGSLHRAQGTSWVPAQD
ncbi:Homeobox protein vent1 [Clarias magur]|uniref:Homeobox protein vent1 n=1 Tax=Clarias magur TaxID=1594786 RepID=A0A8J4TX22_CLAMG|nr:Homeobox protein vent1 [Clarias magur]